MSNRRDLKIDWLTVVLFSLFVLFGWLNIYSVSSKGIAESVFDLSLEHGKQLMFIGIAAVLALVVLTIDSRLFELLAYVLYVLALIGVVAAIFMSRNVKGAHSWIDIGPFRLQPSEFAKYATALALAKYMSTYSFTIKKRSHLLTCFGIIFLPMLLVLLQNDTGTALVFGAFIFVLFREGLNPLYLIVIFFVGCFSLMALVLNIYLVMAFVLLLAGLSYWFLFKRKNLWVHIVMGSVLIAVSLGSNYFVMNVLKTHQRQRIVGLFDPESDIKGVNWNTHQSKIAIGSGGIAGKGYLKGTQTKLDFVPEQETDFIFCTVGEEWGWLGTSAVVLLFFVFLFQLTFLAENSRSLFARIFGYSIASIMFVHIAINIAMTIGLAPVIGIPLPFFSYGGSALMSFTLMTFTVLNFYSNRVNILSGSRT